MVQLMWDGCTGNYLLAALNARLIETTQPPPPRTTRTFNWATYHEAGQVNDDTP